VARHFLLILASLGLFASISDSQADPPFGQAPHHGLTGGIGYSEYHHRPYYYRRYHYAPIYRSPPRRAIHFPHR